MTTQELDKIVNDLELYDHSKEETLATLRRAARLVKSAPESERKKLMDFYGPILNEYHKKYTGTPLFNQSVKWREDTPPQ